MNVALVEHPEDDVDDDDGCHDQKRRRGKGILECLRGPLESTLQGRRSLEFAAHSLNAADGIAERGSGGQVERQGDGRKLSLVADGKRLQLGREMRKGAQWNPRAAGCNDV